MGSPWGMTFDPPFQIGDILWVRETWMQFKFKKPERAIPDDFKEIDYLYRADGEIVNSDGSSMRWKPSIHMPKEAARLFLRVEDVRAERLQEMTAYDADQEGYTGCPFKESVTLSESETEMCWNTSLCPVRYWYCTHTLGEGFGIDIWDKTMKKTDLPKYGWAANPWVWVIEFESITKEVAYTYE
jgi:hypothetical protein